MSFSWLHYFKKCIWVQKWIPKSISVSDFYEWWLLGILVFLMQGEDNFAHQWMTLSFVIQHTILNFSLLCTSHQLGGATYIILCLSKWPQLHKWCKLENKFYEIWKSWIKLIKNWKCQRSSKITGLQCAKCVYLHFQSSDFLIHFHTDGDKMLKS